MALVIFWFTDPWVRLYFSGFSGSLSDEIGLAVTVTTVGTGLWWAVGWVISRIYRKIFKEEMQPNQALLPTPMSVTDRADARSAPDTGAADL